MAIELGEAYVSIIPSAKGLAASLGKELAPVSGIAAAQGQVAGKALGGSLTTAMGNQIAPAATSLLKRITTGLSSPAGIAALGAAAFVGLVNVGKQFGSVNRIIRQETGATGATLEGLAGTVKRVFAVAPEGLKDITQAVDELFKRGIPLGAQLDKLAEQELFLSKITGTDLAATVESTTALMAKFNVPVRDQSRELDVLFKAQQKSGKGFEELVGPLAKGGVSLQQFGFDLDHSIALIAGLSAAGVNVQPVLASLRKAFSVIAKEGKDPQTVLRGIIKELRDGKDPTKAMADAIKLFGARGGAELARAIQQGKLNVDALFKSITNGKDGIIATGEATLTLAEKFTLFKHRALLDLSEFGAKALDVFKTVVNDGGPVLGDLVSSIIRTLQELAPALAPIGLLLVGAFKVAIPVLSSLATGIDTVASVLSHFPTPVIAAAGALAALFLGFRALNAAGGFVSAAAGISSFLADLNPVVATVVVAAAAVTALGVVMKLFGSHSDGAKKEAKALAQTLFDTASSTGIFADGIGTATRGVEQFLKAQIAAGKANHLKDILLDTGTTVGDLSAQLSLGKDDWDAYTKAIGKSAATAAGVSGVFSEIVSKDAVNTLNEQRDAFEASAQAELATVVANGQLKQSDIDAIEARRKNSDGTINYAKVLDRVNGVLAEQAFKQDQVATGNVETSRTFAQLANAISTGSISTTAAGKALEGLGFSTEGAKTKLKDLQSQAQSFATAVSGALPSAADSVKKFGQQIATDQSAVESTFKARGAILQKISDAGGKASQALTDSLAENTKQMQADLHTLATDTDPNKFTENLRAQATNAAQFLGNLRALVSKGFGNLAGILARQGPEAAGALAKGLASNDAKARIAAGAADLLTTTDDAITQFAQGNFASMNAIGVGLSKAVTERFKPDFTPGITPALAAAERALAADGRVSQAAGDAGVAAVQAFGGKLSLNEAINVALQAAHAVLTDDVSVPAAADAAAKKVSDRFKPSFTGRLSPQINAAADALRRDPTVTQAAGTWALATVRAFGANLTLAQAVKLALQTAHQALDNDGTLPAAAGAAAARASARFDPSFSHRVPVALQAAAVALSNDPRISQAAGQKGLQAVRSFEQTFGPLSTAQAAKVALAGAHAAITADPTLKVAAGTKGKETAVEFGKKTDLKGQAAAAMTNAVPGITTNVGALTTAAGSAGHAVGVGFGSGLAQGLTDPDQIARVTSAAEQLAAAIPAPIRRLLGITSPSKVGIQIGQQFVQGITVGFGDTAAIASGGALIATSLTAAGRKAVAAVVASLDISAAVSALPTVGAQISQFASNLVSAFDTQTQALIAYHAAFGVYDADKRKIPKLLERERDATVALHAAQVALFNAAASGAGKPTTDALQRLVDQAKKTLDAVRSNLGSARSQLGVDSGDIAAAAKALNEAQKAVSAAADVSNFNASLRASNAEVIRFQHSLATLLKGGFTDLAAKLAEQGPEAAGALAASLAKNARAARASEREIDRAKRNQATFQAFLAKNFAGLVGVAAETGQSVAAELLDGIKGFLKAGGDAAAVQAQIKQILSPTGGKTAGAELAKSVTDGFNSKLALSGQLKGDRSVLIDTFDAPVVAPVKTQPVTAPTITEAIRQAIQVDLAAPAALPPQKLQIELVSAEGLFEPVTAEFVLTGQRVDRMRAVVRSRGQARGSG